VTATFTLKTYLLTVTRGGSGDGTVTSTAPVGGIGCGADCTESYNHGQMVTLSAAPDATSTFGGWSGGGCMGTGTCIVSMTAAQNVTATFNKIVYALTVGKAGNGTGTVTSSPPGISCGASCSQTWSVGTIVTLTAAPDASSNFTGWSGGGCMGTGTCVVTLTAATNVTATFTLKTYTLTTSLTGSGTGTVTSMPAGITCGADCSEPYNHGQMVTLSASPDVSSNFTGWSGGGCMGTGTCVVTLTAATNVTATFTLKTFTLTVTKSGSGTGTVTAGGTPPPINCGSTCSAVFNYGTVVSLSASPTAPSVFNGWSGSCTGTGSCQVTMTTNRTVTASFLTQYTVNVTLTGDGIGGGWTYVVSTPSGISCRPGGGSGCSATFVDGTSVRLFAATPEANPPPWSTFVNWPTGPCAGSTSPFCAFDLAATTNVQARFNRKANIIFVTKQEFLGGSLGGLQNADNLCGQIASNQGLPGTYLAWLSAGSSATEVRSRILLITSRVNGWVRTDGAEVAGTLVELLGGVLRVPPGVDEFGNPITSNSTVWTNTTPTVRRGQPSPLSLPWRVAGHGGPDCPSER
jgi:hypothetical protein